MKNKSFQIILLVLIGTIIMTFVEGILKPIYLYKSLIKIIVFLSLILIYCFINKDFSYFNIFKIKSKKYFLSSIFLGVFIYIFIITSYLLTKNYIDFSEISSSLISKENISAKNFIFVAIYISFFNSLLEEMFFRGFAFIQLKKFSSLKFSYLFSSITFALYHVFIMGNWFSLPILLLLILALVIAGLIFDYFDRNSIIYNSYVIHMAANFSINTIGFILLGLI